MIEGGSPQANPAVEVESRLTDAVATHEPVVSGGPGEVGSGRDYYWDETKLRKNSSHVISATPGNCTRGTEATMLQIKGRWG